MLQGTNNGKPDSAVLLRAESAGTGVLIGAIWQASTPSWKTYQHQFYRLEAQQEPNAAAKEAVLASAADSASPVARAAASRPLHHLPLGRG